MSKTSNIPKIIHYCWLSDDPVPENMKQYMETWSKLKGYEFIKWDRKRFNLDEHIWAKQAFAAKKYAFAADEVRLFALYHYGGIYLDMDIEVVKKFDDLLNADVMLATEFDDYGIEAGCMGAVKNDPFIKECLGYFKDKPFVEGEVLPKIMRSVMEKSFPERIKDLKTKEFFTAKDYFTGLIKKTPNTYAVHHYAGSWKEKTTSDKELVHARWKFFAENGDSEANIKLYEELMKLKESTREIEHLHHQLSEKQAEIEHMKNDLISNSSSKKMSKVIAHRLSGKVARKVSKLSGHKITKNVHFISRLDEKNIGDMLSSPLKYYEGFFRNRFNTIRHDIYDVDFKVIQKNDLVILGGGGLLYCLNDWQHTINKLLDTCDNVVGWGLGFNTHYSNKAELESIDLSRFGLLGVRDYEYKKELTYCPCASVSAIKDVEDRKPSKKYGIIQHEAFPILENMADEYDRMTNKTDLRSITDFILDHEIIVTNSYHVTYWSQLLKRKVIITDPTSLKFEYFKFKPTMYSGNLEKDSKEARIYNEALTDTLEANNRFFKELKRYIKTIK